MSCNHILPSGPPFVTTTDMKCIFVRTILPTSSLRKLSGNALIEPEYITDSHL